MSIFDEVEDVDLSGDVENPDAVKTGTYPAIITGVVVKHTEPKDDKPKKLGVTIRYIVTDDDDNEEHVGFKNQMWQEIPTKQMIQLCNDGDKNAQRSRFRFRKLMTDMEVPAEKLAHINQELFDSFVDREVYVYITAGNEKNPYAQTRSITARESELTF